MPLTLAPLLAHIAADQPDAPALMHGDAVRSWAEFQDRGARIAAALDAAGVRVGGTVAIDLYNCNEYLEVFAGCLQGRRPSANVNYRYLHDELRRLLDKAQTEALFFHASLADRVLPALDGLEGLKLIVQVDDVGGAPLPVGVRAYDELLAAHEPVAAREPQAGDHFLGFTGGTTGLPKGVMYDLERVTRSSSLLRAGILGIDTSGDEPAPDLARRLRELGQLPVAVPASPLMHSTGLIYASLPTLLAGGAVATLRSRSFDAAELLRTVAEHRVSAVAIVGDAFAKPILAELTRAADGGRPYDTSSLRSMCSAGVAWSADVKDALLQLIPDITLYDACGSTEGTQYGQIVLRAGSVTSTATFQASAGVRVLDEHRRDVPVGEIGMLAAPVPTNGYFNDPAATARIFFELDGVLHACPGDLGQLHADGTITLIGRGTSTINTGGEKVHPEEVEQFVRTLPGVDDCLVFGTPNERFGQQVTAIVQAGGPLDPQTITTAAREHLAGYKVPRQIVLAAVPRFPNGKPDFARARELATGQPAQPV